MISVIVPVYNAEMYLEKCINSILKQTYTDFEIILIDDGSTDSSPQICDNFAKLNGRVKVVHQCNKGPSYSRNLGINISTGTYIAFVDADDWLHEEYLDRMFKNIKKNDSDLCICGYRHYYSKHKYVDYLPSDYFILRAENRININEYRKLLLSEAPLLIGSPCLKIIKREILTQEQIYFPVNIPRNVDLVFNLRLLPYLNNIVFVDKTMYTYRYVKASVFRKYRSNLLEIYSFINSERMETIELLGVDIKEFKKSSDIALVRNCINIIATETRPDSCGKISNKLNIISESISLLKGVPNYKKIYRKLEIKGISPKIIGPFSVYSGSHITTGVTYVLMKIRELLKI